MACKIEEEFNPWPSFVDIFSSVILVLLLFLLVVLANLGYYMQFKYKVSYTGSISNSELIGSPSSTTTSETTQTSSSAANGSNPNSDLNIQIIQEQKQMVLALQNQIAVDETALKSAKGTDEAISAGINIADKKEDTTELQKTITSDDYLVITYKADELFVDDAISKQLKDFLSKAKSKNASHQIFIYSSDTKNQLSATIAKQISLARTMSVRNLIKKFGYEKKDINIDLSVLPEVKEPIDAKNGYIVIKTTK
ncbi:hypothetical protein [Arcobacter sp. s6]|jgi:hypothetical protein|uniref:hypothetical protein n=1 Tax=Arcobacter sp. s6 TaxID=3230363 RepID=UPI0034A05F6E